MDYVHAVRDKDDPIAWTNQHHIAIARESVAKRMLPTSLGIPGRDRARELRVIDAIKEDHTYDREDDPDSIWNGGGR